VEIGQGLEVGAEDLQRKLELLYEVGRLGNAMATRGSVAKGHEKEGDVGIYRSGWAEAQPPRRY
jgi:hypothetical protein